MNLNNQSIRINIHTIFPVTQYYHIPKMSCVRRQFLNNEQSLEYNLLYKLSMAKFWSDDIPMSVISTLITRSPEYSYLSLLYEVFADSTINQQQGLNGRLSLLMSSINEKKDTRLWNAVAFYACASERDSFIAKYQSLNGSYADLTVRSISKYLLTYMDKVNPFGINYYFGTRDMPFKREIEFNFESFCKYMKLKSYINEKNAINALTAFDYVKDLK